MSILICDGYNQIHRARSGFNMGDYPIVFNFFRNLRATVDKFKPTRIYLALEGYPKWRHDLLPEYKANRVVKPEKLAEHDSFLRQKKLIIDLLQYFPISVVRHPDFEADDTIYNIIATAANIGEWVLVSNDSDFTQLLQQKKNVKQWNPILKQFVVPPENYDYVNWKALRGDGSDNIPGIPGVGDKTAEELLLNAHKWHQFFFFDVEGKERLATFERNVELITLKQWDIDTAMKMTSSSPARDWDVVASKFAEWQFKSLLKEETWKKFVATFDHLFGCASV